jgi:glycosyltransferase involved in cell wall biosynthesis
MNISVVIPCYNEQGTLPHLSVKVKALNRMLATEHNLDWVFVDDGSKDFTYKVLQTMFGEEPNIRILRHEVNKGFGEALRTGLGSTTGELVVTIDADTNYDQLEIPIIISHLDEDTDIVTASPWSEAGSEQNFPLHRYVFSRVLSWLYRYFFRDEAPNVYTFTCGFRVYRREVIDNVVFQADDFIATAEILLRSIRMGYRVKEYPTVVHDRKFGRSKLNTLKTIRGHIRVLRSLWRKRDFHAVQRPTATEMAVVEAAEQEPALSN